MRFARGDNSPAGVPHSSPALAGVGRRRCVRDCRLGLAGDPHAKYRPANVVGRVRHGDRLVADCFVNGATSVMAEDGRRSDRWYRVRTRAGTAWLPAVRLAPRTRPAVARCGE